MKIGFIGLGNMATAMIGGILGKGLYTKSDIIGSDKLQATADLAKEKFGITTYADNKEVVKNADIIVFAVKPIFLPEVIEEIKISGLRGRGGAGFPTYAKMDKKADTLILNCAECEPLLRLHRQVLKMYTHEILSTLNEISKILEIDSIYIGVKGSYKRTLAAVNAEIDSFPNMKICTLPEVYPAGDEVVLTYEKRALIYCPIYDIGLFFGS